MADQHLIDIVRRFRGRRVAVLGDLLADEFVYGDIARISREAPVLILEHLRTETVPGGAGNSVANLRSLGAHPVPIGLLGRDEAGRRLRADLRRRRIDVSHVVVDPGFVTPTKSRLLAGGVHTRRQQIVRVDRGASHGDLAPGLRRRVGAALRRALGNAEGLLVADYGYGAATPELVASLLARARSRSIPVTVDSRFRVERFHGVDACTPNQEELERAAGAPRLDDDGVADAARRLARRTRVAAVLVTRGAAGMSLVRGRRRPVVIPAWGGDEVVDVTGAGDTVIATFTLGLVSGADADEAARLANYAAGIAVHKSGTATVSPAELIDAIRQDAGR